MTKPLKIISAALCLIVLSSSAVILSGCGGGYSNSWPYPEEIKTVYVEMFDSKSLRRDHEFDLTDAVCKRIEAQTPYKIVSDRDIADSVLSGEIAGINNLGLTTERRTGSPLENEARVVVRVNWENLQTDEMLLEDEYVTSSASFSAFLGQDFEYAADVAVNKAAQRIVERMQNKF